MCCRLEHKAASELPGKGSGGTGRDLRAPDALVGVSLLRVQLGPAEENEGGLGPGSGRAARFCPQNRHENVRIHPSRREREARRGRDVEAPEQESWPVVRTPPPWRLLACSMYGSVWLHGAARRARTVKGFGMHGFKRRTGRMTKRSPEQERGRGRPPRVEENRRTKTGRR